jgi:glycosyltransferase involved in cell wall biosynthesis
VTPRISILLPTYNRAALLREALASALAQTWPDVEVVVSDNASTDDTAQVVAGFQGDPRLRYHRNETNVGMVANWRGALEHLATGDFFLILSDDDCLLDPRYLEKAAALIQANPGIVLVYAEGRILDTLTGEVQELRLPFGPVEPGTRIFAMRDRVAPQDFTLCNVLFHRARALALDPFSDPLDLSCDSELFLNLCLEGQVGIVKGPVSLYRLHGGNLIRTVYGDPGILAHSVRLFLNPYRRALERGVLSPEERRDFEETCRTALARILLAMARHHPDHFEAFRASLLEQAPLLARQALDFPKVRRKLRHLRLRRAWARLRRHFPGGKG